MIVQTPDAMLHVFIGLGTINYSFSKPLNEALYIPTTKDIKFKAKSWIDTFGTKISKSAGGLFTKFVRKNCCSWYCNVLHCLYWFLFCIDWFMACYIIVAWQTLRESG
jgi:ATP/ADP translocase